MFARKKKFGDKEYYYIVENRREGDKVRQKVIKYLGRKKPTKKELKKLLQQIGD